MSSASRGSLGGGPALDGEVGDVVLGDQLHGVLLAGRAAAGAVRRSMGQGVSTSRTPASPVACRRQASATSASGISSWATARARRGVPGDGGQRRAALLRGSARCSCSRGRRRCGCAARRRRTRRRRRTAPPRLTSRPPVGQHPGGRRRRDAEHRVDDDVDAAAAGVLEPGGERVDVAVERDDGVGARPPAPAPAPRRTGRRPRPGRRRGASPPRRRPARPRRPRRGPARARPACSRRALGEHRPGGDRRTCPRAASGRVGDAGRPAGRPRRPGPGSARRGCRRRAPCRRR